VALGGLIVGGLAVLTFQLGKDPGQHAHAPEFQVLAKALQSDDENVQIEAVHHLAESKDPHAVDLLVKAVRESRSERVLEHITQVLPEFGPAASAAVPALEELGTRADDPFLRYEAAQALFRLHSPEGFAVILALLKEDPPIVVEQKAAQLLAEMTGKEFGLGAGNATERERARERFAQWLAENSAHLRWRQDRQRFE
jgi:HEAT repeat protein